GEVRLCIQRLENRCRVMEISRRARTRPCCPGEPSQLEIAERRLIPLTEQIEDADALAEIMVRLRRSAGACVHPPAQAQEFPPDAAHSRWLQPRADQRQS